jgi:hypothetical protein
MPTACPAGVHEQRGIASTVTGLLDHDGFPHVTNACRFPRDWCYNVPLGLAAGRFEAGPVRGGGHKPSKARAEVPWRADMRTYRVWSHDEEEALRLGVLKHGLGAWEAIRLDVEFASQLCVVPPPLRACTPAP